MILKCLDCSESDPIKFTTDRKRSTGFQAYCRKCHNSRQRDSYLRKRNGHLAYTWDGRSLRRREYKLWLSAHRRAKQKNLPFDIDSRAIVIPARCPVLDIELQHGNGKLHDASPTLDRIIPELGYVKGNVRVISYKANRIKNNATPAELRLVADDSERLVKTMVM